MSLHMIAYMGPYRLLGGRGAFLANEPSCWKKKNNRPGAGGRRESEGRKRDVSQNDHRSQKRIQKPK
jgi:hypothetical protein